jgi:predicted ABC-type transport system involved in lysophospholipase L1 biosynthesis ATPase subunit
MLMVTHSQDVAGKADRVLRLEAGRIVQVSP